MQQINKESVISEIEHAEDNVDSGELSPGWKGVIAEVVGDDGFDGVLLYFPGVRASELLP